jgi:hypothetical protein
MAHPWMTLFIVLALIEAVERVLVAVAAIGSGVVEPEQEAE